MNNQERLTEIKKESKQYGKLTDPPIFFREVDESHFQWLIEQAEQAERYKQALEEIKNYYDKHSWIPTAEFIGHLAKEALEGDE